jgi:hypothetical protein
MMDPKYEQLRMLGAALEAAAHVLDDPITRLEVKGGRVFVWAGHKRVTLRYAYADSYNTQGDVLLGGGHWSAQIEPPGDGDNLLEAKRPSLWKRLFSAGD